MEQINYIKKTKKYQHISYQKRCLLEYMLKNKRKTKITIKQIAIELNLSERTIYREIKRGTVKGLLNSNLTKRNQYIADFAQNKYDEKMTQKTNKLKIGNNIALSQYIEYSIIKEKNSPYAALEKAKAEGFNVNITLKTLYNYINNELFINLTRKNLPYKKKFKKKYKSHKRIRKIGGVSIEQREQIVNDRLELGHWEMDTVVGKREGKSSCLLVLTERVSRKQIIKKIKEKKIEYVISAILSIKRKYPKSFNERFKSITSDNRSEFMNAKAIEELGVKYYYAHSYTSS